MTQGVSGPRGPADRPMSPHLQVWRWHVTMATSIFHRAAIIALYVGALVLAGWLIALATGNEAYDSYTGLLASPLGLLVLFGLTAALAYFALYAVRQLFWDFGRGLDIRTASRTSWLIIIGAALVAVATWAAIFISGAL
jgi:succinate dehydrogenase / fumarate reductase cytochrome b subunit